MVAVSQGREASQRPVQCQRLVLKQALFHGVRRTVARAMRLVLAPPGASHGLRSALRAQERAHTLHAAITRLFWA